MDNNMTEALKNNMKQIIKWFQDNADTEDSIYVEYNFKKESEFGIPKAQDHIRIPKNGIPETGNLWGYHTTYKTIDKIYDYEMLEIVTQWSEIKERFLRNKQEIIDKRNAMNDMVFNFKI